MFSDEPQVSGVRLCNRSSAYCDLGESARATLHAKSQAVSFVCPQAGSQAKQWMTQTGAAIDQCHLED